MTVDIQFNTLNDKLQLLIRQHNRLQKENEKLKEELAEAKTMENGLKGRADELQQQISILKVAAGEMSDKDKKEFDRKIGQYIKEVDRCISFLSQ